MTGILAAQSAEMRAKAETMLQQADRLLCESWNERMWSDGEPIDPSPTIDQAINGGLARDPVLPLQDAERRRPRGDEAPADDLRARPRQPTPLPQMCQGRPTSRSDLATVGLAAAPSSNRALNDVYFALKSPNRRAASERSVKGKDNERIKHDRGNQAEWEITVRSLQEQLRTSWERAVEDSVGSVLRRLSNKVSTEGLVKMTAITVKDCEDVRDAFGRCSALLHSEARGLNSPLPTPDKVQAEITALKTWVEAMASKQKAVKPV
jgi:hypothetical protein